MKELTNSQVKSFKENLIKFKNDLVMKNKFNNRIKKDFAGYYGKNKFKGVKDIRYLFNEGDESAHQHTRNLFNESPFKSIITDIRSNLSKGGHKLIKNGLKYAEEMKDLTYSQVKSFKETLLKFNNDLIMKNIKLKLLKVSNIYLMTLYMKILDVCLMKLMTLNQMRFYLMRLNLMKLNLMRLNIMSLDLMKLNLMSLIILILNPIRLNLMRLDLLKLIIKLLEIKFYKLISSNIESNEDYCIENIKNEFNKLSNNLVEANTKDIRYIVDHINNGENLKETLINLEDIRDKFIAYNDILPFGILSKSSYIDLRKLNIISSVTFDDEYKILKTKSRMMVKSLKALKMPLLLCFLKYISEEELSEEKLSEYIELNGNKVQNVWIDQF